LSELYRADRYFKVWQYTASHCRLLLRSTRDNPPDSRIDIHFGRVGLMVLRPAYDGILIREGSPEECHRISLDYGVEVAIGRLYVIGGNLSSFVVSARPQWHEDRGGSNDPSWFGHMVGTP
jgi:hypothetical protein